MDRRARAFEDLKSSDDWRIEKAEMMAGLGGPVPLQVQQVQSRRGNSGLTFWTSSSFTPGASRSPVEVGPLKQRFDINFDRVLGPASLRAYADRGREEGGHIKRAWKSAIRRAELAPALTPHDLRHTWASWHYALHRDLLVLKLEGGWSSVALVER